MEEELAKLLEIVSDYIVAGGLIAIIVILVIRPIAGWVLRRRGQNGSVTDFVSLVAIVIISFLFALRLDNSVSGYMGGIIGVLVDTLVYSAVSVLMLVAFERMWDIVSEFFSRNDDVVSKEESDKPSDSS